MNAESIRSQAVANARRTFAGLLLIFIFLFSFFPLTAQFKQTHRFEMKQKGSDEYFSLISLKEEGLALLRERNKYEDGKQLWELIFLDTALQQKASIDLPI